MNDLSDDVLPALQAQGVPTSGIAQNFETWMSTMASEQPWLDEAENLANRATFHRASLAVHQSVTLRESQALEREPDDWLLRLALHWCATTANIVTFNYDLLLERAVVSLGFGGSLGDLYGCSLTTRWAPGSSGFLSSSPPRHPIPRIYKLHGSLNWKYGGPQAPTTDQIVLAPGGTQWRRESDVSTSGANPRDAVVHDGLSPMIIPPTSSKSPFYGNLAMRAQWRRALHAMRSASSIALIGYSLPESDLQVREFLRSGISGVKVDVVNPCTDVAERVQRLLGEGIEICTFSGENAIRDYVDATAGHHLRWTLDYDIHTQEHWGLVTEDGLPLEEYSGTRASDQASALREVEARLSERWPGILEHAHRDIWADSHNTGFTRPHKMAYLRRTQE